MERSLYLKRADDCLERVAKWLERFDPDEVDSRLDELIESGEVGE